MILVTTDTVPGRRVEQTLGLVYGATVRGGHLADDVEALVANLVGGEIVEYTRLMAEAREQALDRLIRHARERGANAVLGLRFASTEISEGAAELLAYGTAVRLE